MMNRAPFAGGAAVGLFALALGLATGCGDDGSSSNLKQVSVPSSAEAVEIPHDLPRPVVRDVEGNFFFVANPSVDMDIEVAQATIDDSTIDIVVYDAVEHAAVIRPADADEPFMGRLSGGVSGGVSLRWVGERWRVTDVWWVDSALR